jgi:quercetin dioxygenase-like cupin family protein
LIGHVKDVKDVKIESELVKDVYKKVLVSPKEGWDSHVMREFTVEAFGHTPKHKHPWPHINYVLSGEGELFLSGEITNISSGSFAYIPGEKIHQFRNSSNQPLVFICIVPKEGDQ